MPKTLHFLHIGKTGGSAIKEALKRNIKNQEIYKNEKKIKDNIDEVIDEIYGLFRTKLEKTLNEKETSKAKIVIDALKKKGLDIVEVV